jgi:uncharacterized protein (UPF0128 family)
MSDVMVIKLPRCGQHATVELEVPKNEVVLALAASKEEALKDVKEWGLHLSLTQFRTVATLYMQPALANREVRSKHRPSGQALQASDIETTSANMNP